MSTVDFWRLLLQVLLYIYRYVSLCNLVLSNIYIICWIFVFRLAKGRTNYELHPEIYALRDGVAQTMTLFKPRLGNIHRSTCLHYQQQSTPIRVN